MRVSPKQKALSFWDKGLVFGDTDRGPSAQAADVAMARSSWLGFTPSQLRDSAGFAPDFLRFDRGRKCRSHSVCD